MKKIVPVIVCWSKEKLLPNSNHYSTVSKFKDDDWSKDAWSIVIEFNEPPSKQGNPSTGEAYFLANNAPKDKLKSGEIFELYEGKIKVAIVKIL